MRNPTPSNRQLRIVSALVLLLGTTLPAAAPGGVYPDPPPDFSHPGVYHGTPMGGSSDPLFSPVGGTLARPMLVIYVHFSDTPERPGEDPTWVRERFLGTGFLSVNGWYGANSFGALSFPPAPESQGTPGDGVVVVDAGPIAPYIDTTIPYETRNRTALELADPYVDFSLFDADNDGAVTDDELIVVNVRVAREGLFDGINGDPVDPQDPNGVPDVGEVANRGVAAGGALDGKTAAFHVAMGATAANFMTWIHEITHTTLHLVDLYAFPVGALDVAGPTLGIPDGETFCACAWSKLHWGWAAPTVVTRDGYYQVPLAYTSGASFLLYDPDRGTDDYFLVENRRRLPGTYDRNATDDGLIIWRVDEQKFNPPSGSTGPEGGPITLRKPNPSQAAWDPSDPASPERTMTSPWRDGTPNGLAVRAIGPAGAWIRAYFDVRGPGILVDPFPLDAWGPLPVVAGAPTAIPVPVRNTGEAAGSFTFAYAGLPTGWDATPLSATLPAGVDETLALALAPPHDAPVGIRILTVGGVSDADPQVGSSGTFEVEVVHEADLAVTAVEVEGLAAEMLVGEEQTVTVRARVTNLGPSWPTDATVTGSAAAPGLSMAPGAWSDPAPAIAASEVREFARTVTVSCAGSGARSATFSAAVAPDFAADVDPNPANDSAQVSLPVECVTPVALNIAPGSFPNPVQPDSPGVVPLAVLTTAAGEYDLPLPFDAIRIVPDSVRFGPESLVWTQTGGAGVAHRRGHPEDALELDEKTKDGDTDLVLHFPANQTGIAAGDAAACVKGRWDAGGELQTFFGCDRLVVVPR
ncbi:MAG: hypothetical protein P1P84_24270 [Deferrisomatales bacterium]|nr:hypothetical protein [Deferrisomatales bacterium]